MKRILWLLGILLPVFCCAQQSVLEKSGKKPAWVTNLESGFLTGTGKGATVQDAQAQALLQVKAQIVSSVADRVVSTSTLETRELTVDDVSTQLQSFSGLIQSQSGKQDFLTGVSAVRIAGQYWEKIQDKSTKSVWYQCYIKYPFSTFELNGLVDEFKKKDQELTDELTKALTMLETFQSVENIKDARSMLTMLEQVFVDERKVKARAGVEKSDALLSSVVIRDEGSTTGYLRYALYIANRRISAAVRPVVSAPCAIIEDRKTGTEICEIRYRYDECYGDTDAKIKLVYNFGGAKTERLFYFDVNEGKAKVAVTGTIRFSEGTIEGEKMLNARCAFEVQSAFSSPCELTSVRFEWKGFSVDLPLDVKIAGKGLHPVSVIIPQLPMAIVSTVLNPEQLLNGSLLYRSEEGKEMMVRLYQRTYITSW